MWQNYVSKPEPLAPESDAPLTVLHGLAEVVVTGALTFVQYFGLTLFCDSARTGETQHPEQSLCKYHHINS